MESMSLEFFDVHHHVGDPTLSHAVRFPGTGEDIVREQEVRTRIRLMDKVGIAQALVMPAHTYDRSEGIAATRRENDAIAGYRDANRDRFPVAGGVIEPLDFSAQREEIRRISSELGLVGISFHTEYQGVDIDSIAMMRCLDYMGEVGLIPFIHAPNNTVSEATWRLAKVARALPDVTILALEPFWTLEGMHASYLLAEIAENVVFDTSSCFEFTVLVDFIHNFGADRVLYGSHMYTDLSGTGEETPNHRRQALLRHELSVSSLTDHEKALIAKDNARRLFGLGDAI
jgi:predicted TIM-barrel fold metal-dependent hydrolase